MKKVLTIVVSLLLVLGMFVACSDEPKDKVQNNATIKTCTLDDKSMGLIEYNNQFMVITFEDGNKYSCSCPFVTKEDLEEDEYAYDSGANTLSTLSGRRGPIDETASLSAAKPCYIETMDFGEVLAATSITYDSVTYTLNMGN